VSSALARVGALARWHAEMLQGIRGKPGNWHTWKTDDLWMAACAEKTAIEMEAQGDLDRARDFTAWALCRFHNIKDEWYAGQRTRAHETKAGKALLAKLHDDVRLKGPWAGVTPSRPPQWAGAR
jgi:hypothetical protein